jgi:hypothetical protein
MLTGSVEHCRLWQTCPLAECPIDWRTGRGQQGWVAIPSVGSDDSRLKGWSRMPAENRVGSPHGARHSESWVCETKAGVNCGNDSGETGVIEDGGEDVPRGQTTIPNRDPPDGSIPEPGSHEKGCHITRLWSHSLWSCLGAIMLGRGGDESVYRGTGYTVRVPALTWTGSPKKPV